MYHLLKRDDKKKKKKKKKRRQKNKINQLKLQTNRSTSLRMRTKLFYHQKYDFEKIGLKV